MRFDRLATFERFTPANELDDTGGTWSTLFRAWVAIQPFTAREVLNTPQIEQHETHRVRTHWRDGVSPRDRFKIAKATLVNQDDISDPLNYRYFEIDSVMNTREHNRELELLCTEAS